MMSEFANIILIFIMGVLATWYFWDADNDEDINDAYDVQGRYVGYLAIKLSFYLFVVEMLEILPDKWGSIVMYMVGSLVCLGAVILGYYQYRKQEKIYSRNMTAKEKMKDNSQYVFIYAGFWFVAGIAIIVLN